MKRTESAFAKLVGDTATQQRLYYELSQARVFERFETNELDTEGFLAALWAKAPGLGREAICAAWSAMLLDFPSERLELLRRWRAAGYRLFLLSNINEIHLADVYKIVENAHGLDAQSFDNLFDRAFYSHLIGCRKPDPATYLRVCELANIRPEETLFLDDNAPNIEGATRAGLHAFLHPANSDLEASVKNALHAANHSKIKIL